MPSTSPPKFTLKLPLFSRQSSNRQPPNKRRASMSATQGPPLKPCLKNSSEGNGSKPQRTVSATAPAPDPSVLQASRPRLSKQMSLPVTVSLASCSSSSLANLPLSTPALSYLGSPLTPVMSPLSAVSSDTTASSLVPLSPCCEKCHKGTDYGFVQDDSEYFERWSKNARIKRARDKELEEQAEKAALDYANPYFGGFTPASSPYAFQRGRRQPSFLNPTSKPCGHSSVKQESKLPTLAECVDELDMSRKRINRIQSKPETDAMDTNISDTKPGGTENGNSASSAAKEAISESSEDELATNLGDDFLEALKEADKLPPQNLSRPQNSRSTSQSNSSRTGTSPNGGRGWSNDIPSRERSGSDSSAMWQKWVGGFGSGMAVVH